jgi:hypothetical protein
LTASSIAVRRGLDPRIRLFERLFEKEMDCRVKPGNDASRRFPSGT